MKNILKSTLTAGLVLLLGKRVLLRRLLAGTGLLRHLGLGAGRLGGSRCARGNRQQDGRDDEPGPRCSVQPHGAETAPGAWDNKRSMECSPQRPTSWRIAMAPRTLLPAASNRGE